MGSAGLLGLRLFRVGGRSMAPAIEPGAVVLVRGYGRRRPRPGDICVFRAREGGLMLKRIAACIEGGAFRVAGDSALSAPSVDIGPVAAQALLGRVLLTLRPRWRRRAAHGGRQRARGVDKP
jgi:hypothetical protein